MRRSRPAQFLKWFRRSEECEDASVARPPALERSGMLVASFFCRRLRASQFIFFQCIVQQVLVSSQAMAFKVSGQLFLLASW